MACDTEGGKGIRDGEICPAVRPKGGSSSLTCVGKLAQREQASNAQSRARGHRGKRKTERRCTRWHPRTFSNTFSCQGEWASVVKGATGHRPCPQQHRSRNASQALLEVHRSVSVCLCEKHTIWKRAPAGHHYYSPDNTHDQEDQHTCIWPRPECHISVFYRIPCFIFYFFWSPNFKLTVQFYFF